jgi:hypothetical protein
MLKFGTVVPILESERNDFMRIEYANLTAGTANLRNCRMTTPALKRALSVSEVSSNLEFALSQAPDVRAAKVARGKALVADPNYPSREEIRQIARLLAARWQDTRS